MENKNNWIMFDQQETELSRNSVFALLNKSN